MAITEKTHYLSGLPVNKLTAFWQRQSDGDNCGPFTVAIATNLRADSHVLDGDVVEAAMEKKGWKPKGFGVPVWYGYEKALSAFNPGALVFRYKNASIADLKQAISANKISIVCVSWQTNSEILKMFFTGGKLTVGHYMVAVGYDTQGFYFLDPGFEPAQRMNVLHLYSYADFEQIWLKQPNIFIPPGTLFTVDNR